MAKLPQRWIVVVLAVCAVAPAWAQQRGQRQDGQVVRRFVLSQLPPPDRHAPVRPMHAPLPFGPPQPAPPELLVGLPPLDAAQADAGMPPKVTALFQAQARENGAAPPDTTGAVSDNFVLTVTNWVITVHDRQGKLLNWAGLNNFWNDKGGNGTYYGDPRYVYDPHGKRWVAVALQLLPKGYASVVLATSQSEDPSGAWTVVQLANAATMSTDQPLLGVTTNRIVVQANVYDGTLDPNANAQYAHSAVWSLDKADLYAGGNGKAVTWAVAQQFALAPALNWDAVADAYLVASTGPGGPVLMKIGGAVGQDELQDVAVLPWVAAGKAFPGVQDGGKQRGTKVGVGAGDSRIHDAVLRNGSLWYTHSWFFAQPSYSGRPGVVWRQVALDGKVLQTGSYYVPGEALTHPSLAVDAAGNVLIGCSHMTADTYPSAAFLYHRHDAPPGSTQAVAPLVAGQGVYDYQVPPWGNRWGDYSATVIDPAGEDLWTVQELALQPDVDDGVWAVAWARVSAAADSCAVNADCTALLRCESGHCVADVPPGEPCAQGGDCFAGSCVQGVCCVEACAETCHWCRPGDDINANSVHMPGECVAINKGECDDGDACTPVSICVGGSCFGKKISCDDGNACTEDSCTPASGCNFAYSTSPCDDGQPCTTGTDHCQQGACVGGSPLVCEPDPLQCEIGGACAADGTCVFGQAKDGARCGDGTCRDGLCEKPAPHVGLVGCGAAPAGRSAAALLMMLAALGLVRGLGCLTGRQEMPNIPPMGGFTARPPH